MRCQNYYQERGGRRGTITELPTASTYYLLRLTLFLLSALIAASGRPRNRTPKYHLLGKVELYTCRYHPRIYRLIPKHIHKLLHTAHEVAGTIQSPPVFSRLGKGQTRNDVRDIHFNSIFATEIIYFHLHSVTADNLGAKVRFSWKSFNNMVFI